MNRRSVTGLGAALALLIAVLAVVLAGKGDRESGNLLLFPGLRDELNEVSRIVVTGPGNETIATLERGPEQWTVTNRENYPADIARIRQNLTALADARIIEEKTANPEFYERLGVQGMESPSATGLQLTASGSKQSVDLIIGQTAPGGQGMTYVRPADEATSLLVEASFNPGRTSGEWLDRSLTDIPAARIESVTIEHPGGETLHISRARKTAEEDSPAGDDAQDGLVEFVVAELPKGRELSYPGAANAVAGVLADLRLEDVMARDALTALPDKPVVARFATTDGLVIEASTWRVGNGTKVTFSASGEGAAAKEASRLNARLGGWVYTLPDYKTEQLTRKPGELLAPTL